MRGKGSVYRPNDREVWWIKYYRRGVAIRESSRSTDKRVAEKLLSQRKHEIVADAMGLMAFTGPISERLRVSDILEDAVRNYCIRKNLAIVNAPAAMRTRQKQLLVYFGEMKALRVDDKEIGGYIEMRRQDGMKPATINRELELLRRGFRLAHDARKMPWYPRVPRLAEHNVRTGYFETADFEAVVERLPHEFADFARFAYWTGMRKGEVASLQWADVDRSARILRLRPEHSKNREGRVIPLVEELWTIIERRWAERVVKTVQGDMMSQWVFHREGYPVLYKSFERHWVEAREATGMMHALFHDLRRTAIRNMIRAGVRETVAMRISGHKTRSVFDRYNIVDERDLAEALTMTVEYMRSRPKEERVVRVLGERREK